MLDDLRASTSLHRVLHMFRFLHFCFTLNIQKFIYIYLTYFDEINTTKINMLHKKNSFDAGPEQKRCIFVETQVVVIYLFVRVAVLQHQRINKK